DVHQAVGVEALVELHVAAEIGDAERVAVVGDAGHHLAHDLARAGAALLGARAEAQAVERAADARAHAGDVAHDAPDAGRRTFIGNDLARMVVALVADDRRVALALVLAERDDARVLAGTEDHLRRLGGKPAEQGARRLVRAVLAPQDVETHDLGPAQR